MTAGRTAMFHIDGEFVLSPVRFAGSQSAQSDHSLLECGALCPGLMNLTEDWIIGFFEGEGSFHSARGRSRDRIYPRFTLTQKEYDLLARIKGYFGFGGINYADQPTGRVWHSVVCNKHDLKLVIAFPDGRIRSKKKIREYNQWKCRFSSYFDNPRAYLRRK